MEIIHKYFADKRKKQLRELADIASVNDEILYKLKQYYFFQVYFADERARNYYSKRAGWTLDFIAQDNSLILSDLSPRLIARACSEDTTADYGTIQLLSNIDFSSYDYGELVDVCLNLCSDSASSYVHKIYSLRVLRKIIIDNPELARECSDGLNESFKHFTAPSLVSTKNNFNKFLAKYLKSQ